PGVFFPCVTGRRPAPPDAFGENHEDRTLRVELRWCAWNTAQRARSEKPEVRIMKRARIAVLALAVLAAGNASADGAGKSLALCADPGKMPLSNQKGEGFENKIAEVLGDRIGARITYYWRPSIERGLMRTTLSEGNCDVWLDMASDTEGAAITTPLYRSA